MGTAQMEKKNERGGGRRAIAKAIIEQYKPTTAEEMQEALRDIFGPMFEAMLQGEMDRHLGYETNDRGAKSTTNRRNGYTEKTVKSSMGEIEIHTPRDQDGSFEPHLIPKRAKDVSGIEDKVLSMYAKGMSQRDIAGTIEEIYGFEISHETISKEWAAASAVTHSLKISIFFLCPLDGARFNFCTAGRFQICPWANRSRSRWICLAYRSSSEKTQPQYFCI